MCHRALHWLMLEANFSDRFTCEIIDYIRLLNSQLPPLRKEKQFCWKQMSGAPQVVNAMSRMRGYSASSCCISIYW
ncbi:hypothetical protein V5799_002649 [Amblyomma americanum]|uniref:Uncharacterized protein n=1 Tax=Amblyomma americanum TaxID=6943 RepID=A0AAQ4DB81_AMBAM